MRHRTGMADIQLVVQMERHTDRQVDRQKDRKTYRKTDEELINRHMHGLTDEQTDRRDEISRDTKK